MANELTMTVSVAFAKGNVASIARQAVGKTITVAGTKYQASVQTIGTTQEAIVMGDVTSPGYIWVKNLDATNYVTIRPATGGTDTIKLKAGEIALFRLVGAAPFAIANTAAVAIEYIVFDD
jgi:hypothetical protein